MSCLSRETLNLMVGGKERLTWGARCLRLKNLLRSKISSLANVDVSTNLDFWLLRDFRTELPKPASCVHDVPPHTSGPGGAH